MFLVRFKCNEVHSVLSFLGLVILLLLFIWFWLFNEVQATEIAEEIDVQLSAPTKSSQRPKKRTMCCYFCHIPGQSKRTCTCSQAQSWRKRMAVVSRRKLRVSFLLTIVTIVVSRRMVVSVLLLFLCFSLDMHL